MSFYILSIILCCVSVVPSQPSEFKGEAKSETSILLSWVAPPQGGPDNQITGYELVYRRAGETEEVGMEGRIARIISFDYVPFLKNVFSPTCLFLHPEEDKLRTDYLLPFEGLKGLLHLYLPTGCQKQTWNWCIYE